MKINSCRYNNALLALIFLWPIALEALVFIGTGISVPGVGKLEYSMFGAVGILNKAAELIFFAALLLVCKFKSNLLRCFFCFLYLLLLAIHSAQFLAVYYDQTQINSVMLAAVDEIGLVVNSFSIATILVPLCVQTVLLLIAVKYLKLFNLSVKQRITYLSSATLLLLAWLFVYNIHVVRNLALNASINMEAPAYGLMKVLFKQQHYEKKTLIPLNASDLQAAKKYHLNLYKKGQMAEVVYTHSAIPPINKTKKINVIIIFAESLSARLLGTYNDKLKPFTPNINAFAKQSLVIDNYYNHAIPTVNGIRGQLCSVFSNLGYDPQSKETLNKLAENAYHECLPNILSTQGYDTYYLTHSVMHTYDIKSLARFLHFSKVYYNVQAITELLGETDSALTGTLSDHQVMDALWQLVSHKTKANKPFFVAVSTIQTHRAIVLKQDGDTVLPAQKAPMPLVQVYNFDDAFGKFWQAFNHSPLKNNTIIILTGDHVSPPATDYLTAVGVTQKDLNFDKMSMIIYDPVNHLHGRLVANSTSLDLAPSLLHLLGIKTTPHRFQGLSLFGDRELYQATASLIGNEVLIMNRDNAQRVSNPCGNQPNEACSLLKVINNSEILDAEQ